jgi:hypothetical protein
MGGTEMPIILNVDDGTFHRVTDAASPETVQHENGSQPNAQIGGWCAMCGVPFSGANFELRTMGSHGAICDECVPMVWRECEGCGETGTRNFFHVWRNRSDFSQTLQGRISAHVMAHDGCADGANLCEQDGCIPTMRDARILECVRGWKHHSFDDG